jgi:hypothetical protein
MQWHAMYTCRVTEKARRERERERREQYKQVRAHVQKEDGRMQAYGWSVPTKFQPFSSPRSTHVPVPVPIYCRPLLADEPTLKVCREYLCIVFAGVVCCCKFSVRLSQFSENDTFDVITII